jgi:hypothetical protein
MNDDDQGNVIQFPVASSSNKSKAESPPGSTGEESAKESKRYPSVQITKDSVSRLIKALSTIHMATTYRATRNEVCKSNIVSANFPCRLNCACYVNICAAMGLEAFLGGPSQDEAVLLVDAEHELISKIYVDLVDEDEDADNTEE